MLKKTYNTILDEHLHILISQGNHEAYEKLKKRYYHHAVHLCRDFLIRYDESGIVVSELMSVCHDCFSSIVKKYDASLSSFYSFWKRITSHNLAEYLQENSYQCDASGFKGDLSIDQEIEDNHTFASIICEKDDERAKRKAVFDAKRIISKHADSFTKKEAALLNLILEGYSIADLEHSGVLRRSQLYLTFNTAIEKIKRIMETKKK